jgi:hypothetical protein
VKVDVYDPIRAPVGIATETAGVSVYTPIPVLEFVLKNLTAVGAVTAAGIATGVVTL